MFWKIKPEVFCTGDDRRGEEEVMVIGFVTIVTGFFKDPSPCNCKYEFNSVCI